MKKRIKEFNLNLSKLSKSFDKLNNSVKNAQINLREVKYAIWKLTFKSQKQFIYSICFIILILAIFEIIWYLIKIN